MLRIHAFLVIFALSLVSDAGALGIKDRLHTPAREFSNIDKSAFLDVLVIGERLLSVGERGVIAYSDDAGSTWLQAKVPVSTMLTGVYFVDEKLGWAVGHSGVILRTLDGGENWTLQFNGNDANKALLAEAKEKLNELKEEYAEADEEDKEDLEYEVEDAEFVMSNAEFDSELGPANPLLDVYFENDSKGYVVGAYGLFFVTEDGGKSWISWANRLENFDRYHLNAIRRLSDGTLLIVGEAGMMFASYDDGEYWETLYGPYQGSYFGIEETGATGEVIVFGLKGNVFRSPDQGQSWERVVVPATTSLTASVSDDEGNIILTGFSGVVIRSKDGGHSFQKVKQSGLESFNGVAALKNSELILVSDKGIHFQSY